MLNYARAQYNKLNGEATGGCVSKYFYQSSTYVTMRRLPLDNRAVNRIIADFGVILSEDQRSVATSLPLVGRGFKGPGTSIVHWNGVVEEKDGQQRT